MAGIGPGEVAAATRTLMRGNLTLYSTGGPSRVGAFEKELAAAMGVRHDLAVNSGTNALICALVGAGIGPGDEALTIDPDDVERKLTPETRAVIPVHMINLVCDMDRIMSLANEKDLVVIGDACQAIGAGYKGCRVGSIGAPPHRLAPPGGRYQR